MSLPKKIFITSTIALIVILLLWGVYLLSFKQTPSSSDSEIATTTSEKPSEQPIISKNATITALTDEPILAPIISPTGDSIKYYAKATGNAFEVDILSHNKKTLSSAELLNLSDIIWSPDTNKVVSRFPKDSLSSKFSSYDYLQNKNVGLADGIADLIWQNNNKIIYKYSKSTTDKQTLNVADPDGSNWKKIITLPNGDARVAIIPKTGLVSFWNKPDSLTQATMSSVPVFGEEIKTITQGKFGADYLWSSDGSFLLESSIETTDVTKLQLSVMNSVGGEYKTLGIPTMVSKCAWSKNNTTIYYALPSSIPAGATMPNDYNDAKFNTSDTFWKVDVTTGEKTRIITLDKIDQAYDATELFLSPDESSLFFVNRIDGKLYQLSL
jgi:hypothetical protein